MLLNNELNIAITKNVFLAVIVFFVPRDSKLNRHCFVSNCLLSRCNLVRL
jgi:hypothetical protein